MSSKISELEKIVNPSGDELVIVAYNGSNYSIRVTDLIRSITKASFGLDKVNNTADIDKPVSTAVSQALAQKAPFNHTHDFSSIVQDVLGSLSIELEKYCLKDHKHAVTDIIDLDKLLDTKAASQHSHTLQDIQNLQKELDNIALSISTAMKKYITDNTITIGLTQW